MLIRFPKDDPSVGQRVQCALGYGEVRIDDGGDLLQLVAAGGSSTPFQSEATKSENKQTELVPK